MRFRFRPSRTRIVAALTLVVVGVAAGVAHAVTPGVDPASVTTDEVPAGLQVEAVAEHALEGSGVPGVEPGSVHLDDGVQERDELVDHAVMGVLVVESQLGDVHRLRVPSTRPAANFFYQLSGVRHRSTRLHPDDIGATMTR